MDPVSIAAVGWSISTAGWLVSPIFSKLINKCFSYLGFQSPDRIQKLETKVLQLKLMLEAAQASASSHLEMAKLEKWTRSLKSGFYEAEDVLDEIDYGRLESQIRSRNRSDSSTPDIGTITDLDVPRLLRSKLEGVLNMIEKLIDEGHNFLSLLKLPAGYESMNSGTHITWKSPTNRLQTTSVPPTVVFGRDGDLEMIRRMLRDTPANGNPISTKCYSVIGIHGIPGSGKTTLAQYVCEKEREDSYFSLVMWIYVSQNFSVDTIFSEMLEIASGGKRRRLSNLDLLQRTLEATLQGKRFLLVLDDIWYDRSVREQKFDLLLSPLKVGEMGSRILVTSRTAETVKALGAQNLVAISDLDKEQFFSMFMHYALDGVTITDQALLREHQLIGRKIAGKLGESPLAARTVAGQLRRRLDIDFWRRCLNRDLLNDTMGALWWSYQQLEEPVRQCFTYCSMFPRRHELHRHELVSLWMAQGFVEAANREEDMEAIAHDHFDVLLSCSFIQQKVESSGREHITIHDLLHELARRVSGNDCFAIDEGTVGQIPQDVRHLFIKSYNRKMCTEQILNLKALRTIFFYQWTQYMTGEDFEAMLNSLKKLRALCVNLRSKGKIPECIGDMKHLRYLSFNGYGIVEVPSMIMPPTFTKLYHLQMILAPPDSLHCASNLEMSNLVNLRSMPTTGLNWGNFPYIGRLTLLQSLSVFKVRKARGYGIQQLQYLNNLRHSLTIEGLENVISTEEARQAKLSNKIHVSELVLKWSTGDLDSNFAVGTSNVPLTKRRRIAWLLKAGCSSEDLVEGRTFDQSLDQDEILGALHPPPFVRSLKICGYSGSTYPSWLSGEQSTLENLQYLEFSFCKGSGGPLEFSQVLVNLRILKILNCSWITLPESMETLKSLQYLFIEGSGNILSLPRLPPSVEKVELAHWDGSDAPPKINGFFNCLGTLVISRCSWNTLPENMECQTSLHELIISHCNENLSLHRLPSSLKKLSLTKWNGSAPPCIGEFLVNLPSLEIYDCGWNYLPENMEHLTMLEELSIWDCKEILSLTRLPQSLKKLKLINLDGSDAAPPWNSECLVNLSELLILGCSWSSLPEMEPLSSLEELIISSCKNIQSLTRFPGSLKKLKLESWKHPYEHCLISQFLVNLRELEFSSCEWSSFPEGMELLTSLEVLIIFFCKNVRSLPRLPPSLKKLQIELCHRSLKETCQMEGHPNWQKVVHIPEKIFLRCG